MSVIFFSLLRSRLIHADFVPPKADRTESYTRTTPFQERHDTSVEYVNHSSLDTFLKFPRS